MKKMLLITALVAVNAHALTFRNIKLDNATHAYSCRRHSVDINQDDTGVCVIKDNKVCYHPNSADANPSYGLLFELTTAEYDQKIGDFANDLIL